MTATHDTPTSEWQHSHALESGDIIRDEHGEYTVTVNEDGSVRFDGETFSEREITVALRDSVIERSDGLSHELASY